MYAFGYSEKCLNGDSALFVYEGLTDIEQPLFKLKDSQASPGFSGAPLLNLRTGGVCGILKRSRDIYTNLGGHAVPSEIIFSSFTQLLSIQKKYHQRNRSWVKWINDSQIFAEEFKSKTKIALQSIGYTIFDNVPFPGCSVDMYVELEQPLLVHRVIVITQSKLTEVDIKQVKELAHIVDDITTRAIPVSGLLVSEAGFTQESYNYGKSKGLSLITIDDLLKKSFDPSRIASQIIKNFENDTLKEVYVDLSCQVTEKSGGTIYKPVERFFDDFFPKTKRPGIAVLGNFGSGKSSLSKHYSYLLAERWNYENTNSKTSDKQQNRSFLPIYINLRDIDNFYSLENTIFKVIQTQYHYPSATLEGFLSWLRNGLTLIILDGFDEMATKMDRLAINKNLECLKKLSTTYGVKLLLTCRTHFFKTQVEEQALGNMIRLYLLDWGAKELEDYVSKFNPDKRDDSLNIIRSTYNLEELARTPIFLNMITETIGNMGGVINQAKLYQIYTDRWIQGQDYRSSLSPDQKQFFMEELALQMFLSGDLRIDHTKLPNKIQELLLGIDYTTLKVFDRDIRTCSFLIRTPDGLYHFIHKSFMEFFTAFRLAKDVKSNAFESFSIREISLEIAGFFANYFDSDPACLINGLLRNSDSIARSNFAFSLGFVPFSEEVFDALKFSIRTDSSIRTRYSSVEAMASFKVESVAQEFIKLARSETDKDFRTHCIRKMSSFIKYEGIIQFLKSLLIYPKTSEEICAVLEIIESNQSSNFLNELSTFFESEFWKYNKKASGALIRVIQSLADLSFAQNLSSMKKELVDRELLSLIEEAITDLRVLFRSEIEKDARAHKADKRRRSTNQKLLRGKYGLMIDEDHLNLFMAYLYETKNKKIKGL